MLTVLCVLRSGGLYTADYVVRLRGMVTRHLTVPHNFACLSDSTGVPLLHSWPGWWSKLELFRFSGPTLYFDLDTILLKSIDALARAVLSLSRQEFLMLRAFSPKHDWASGIMGWNGDFQFIYEKHRTAGSGSYVMDQCFIRDELQSYGIAIRSVQDSLDGVHSYLWHCQAGCPPQARIVCFHKRPKPHELDEPWVRQHWC